MSADVHEKTNEVRNPLAMVPPWSGRSCIAPPERRNMSADVHEKANEVSEAFAMVTSCSGRTRFSPP